MKLSNGMGLMQDCEARRHNNVNSDRQLEPQSVVLFLLESELTVFIEVEPYTTTTRPPALSFVLAYLSYLCTANKLPSLPPSGLL